MSQNLPENMPVPKVPINAQIIADAADEYGADRADLVEALENIDGHLAEHAQDIHARTIRELGEDAIIREGGMFDLLYVDPDEWIELQERLSLAENVCRAAKTSHINEICRLIESIDRLDHVDELVTNDMLVMPTPFIQALMEGGLSHRQAVIQALRSEGDTQERIGEKMGIATGTVKSHCDRIDRKIEQARRLLDLVENDPA